MSTRSKIRFANLLGNEQRELLTNEEITALARLIQHGKAARKRIRYAPTRERIVLAEAIRAGNAARKEMTYANEALILPIAQTYAHRWDMPMEDLFQEGHFGLVDAVNTFDCRRNILFSTYATTCIKRAIKRAIDYQMRTVRIPYWALTILGKYRKKRMNLMDVLGRDPLPHEMSAAMNLAPRTEERLRSASEQTITSLTHLPANELDALAEYCADEERSTTLAATETETIRRNVRISLKQLTEHEYFIVVALLGIYGQKPWKQKEIAAALKMSRDYVRNTFRRALEKLKEDPHLQQIA